MIKALAIALGIFGLLCFTIPIYQAFRGVLW